MISSVAFSGTRRRIIFELVPDALEPPESVPALSPLKSSRAGGTVAWYAPALQESRRLPPEQVGLLMGLEIGRAGHWARGVTSPYSTI